MTRKQSEPLRERASGLKYISARQFVFFLAVKCTTMPDKVIRIICDDLSTKK